MRNVILVLLFLSSNNIFSQFTNQDIRNIGWEVHTKNYREQYEKSIELITEALESHPEVSELYLMRGETKAEMANHKGAIQDYTKAIKFSTGFKKPYRKRAWSRAKIGDYDGSMADHKKLGNFTSNTYKGEYFYLRRGKSKAELGYHTGAISDFTKSIQIEPNFDQAYNKRAFSKLKLGDKSGACSDWSKAGELGMGTVYKLIRKYCN